MAFIKLKRMFFKLLRKTPATQEMVQYWKRSHAVMAKCTKKDGVIIMKMQGEKYDFPGYPRGYILFGKLPKLKHEIKNQVFNDSWALLEAGASHSDVAHSVWDRMPGIYQLMEESRYDMVPQSGMAPAVREIYRAWNKASPETHQLRDLVTFIFQEDDAYRFRFQWMVDYMPGWLMRFSPDPVRLFERGLEWMENAEVIGDMKERVRLIRRIMMVILSDKHNRDVFSGIFKEIDWRKVKMTKADKYYFRGKYFKVDLDKFDY